MNVSSSGGSRKPYVNTKQTSLILDVLGGTRILRNLCTIKITKYYYRRKSRSQTSDDMDKWKSRGGKSHRREEKKKIREGTESEERSCRRAKSLKVANHHHCVFPMICGSGGSKVGLLKRVRSHLARWEMNERWKIARHYGGKRKSECTKHLMLWPFLEVEMSKKCAKHISKSKCKKHHMYALRKVAFWRIRSSDFAWQVQRFVRPGLTFSWQVQYCT